MVANTANRVPSNTAREVNDRIYESTQRVIEYYRGHPREIPVRLRELDEEWDIERVLETGSATLSLTGFVLSALSSRRWLLLPLAVQSFFLQHAIQGWCPPLPMLRRLGVRTAEEISRERSALHHILATRPPSDEYEEMGQSR